MMIQLTKYCWATVLLFSITLPLNASVHTDSKDRAKPIKPDAIYSISIESHPEQSPAGYTLGIFTDENETQRVAHLTRPLSGRIVDIETYDIDDDAVDELVVIMEESTSTEIRLHFDVFEFDGDALTRVEDFEPNSNLAKLVDKHTQSL